MAGKVGQGRFLAGAVQVDVDVGRLRQSGVAVIQHDLEGAARGREFQPRLVERGAGRIDGEFARQLIVTAQPLPARKHLVEFENQRACKDVELVEETAEDIVARVDQAGQLAGGGHDRRGRLGELDFGGRQSAISVHDDLDFAADSFGDEKIAPGVDDDLAAWLLLDADIDQLGQVLEGDHPLVAKPDGVASRDISSLRLGDLDVQRADFLGQLVDPRCHVADALVQARAERLDPPSHSPHLFGELVSGEDCQVADRGVLRLVENLRDAREELVERSTQVGVAEFVDNALKFRIRLLNDLASSTVAGGAAQPRFQEMIHLLDHGLDLHAQSQQQPPMPLGRGGRKDHLLAKIAGSIGIGDVLPDHLHGDLVRLQ